MNYGTVVAGMMLMLISMSSQAFVQGEAEPDGQTHEYNIELDSLDIQNNRVGGMTPEFSWNLGGDYAVIFHCEKGDLLQQAIHYTTRTNMAPSGPNRYKLNDYLDIEAKVWIGGYVNDYIPVPFTNESNKMPLTYCYKSHRGGGIARVNNIQSGSKGKIVFIVTKPIVNGINISQQALLELAGDLGGKEIPTTPITRVRIQSGIITVPDKCTFNRGQKISVEFGNLPNSASKLNGSAYSQSVPIHVECEGGSFSQGELNIQLGVQTNTASGTAEFNHSLLGTIGEGKKRSDLGISLKDQNGRSVEPNKFYDMHGFYKNQGDWNLVAAPVANSSTGSVKEGEFEASATVVAQFQ